MQGVRRVMIFCVMIAILPAVLIMIPLYLRHYVFIDVIYPVAESDVLAIQEGISSIFCDGLILKMNSSFNAFQLLGTPKITGKRKHIRLKKSMVLPDDTLEYWGFYLLKGATVSLKVCSRHEGARILVVRGDKNLETCGLMEHNFKKQSTNMDVEYNRVKTYETPAEVIGHIDIDAEYNTAKEDLSDTDKYKTVDLSKSTRRNIQSEENNVDLDKSNSSKYRHHKRHVRKWQKVLKLKEMLEDEEIQARKKRNTLTPIDAPILHGGNAFNISDDNPNSASVSSFEGGLFTCYDGKILLARGFASSKWCTNINYLENSNHMVTEHSVASDGYYYYIFYSDNDFIKNDIHARFDILKPTYRFSDSSSRECVNQTTCEFPIHLMSDETVIVEVPTRDGIEHEADDITMLISTCKPRMGIYMIFPIVVLVLILICAFL